MVPDITEILSQIEPNNPAAADQLLPVVYSELRKLAQARLGNEKPGQTLQATALVHEAYLRLLGPKHAGDQKWNDRGHFFAAAAEAMRRILVEIARRKRGPKAGGHLKRVELHDDLSPDTPSDPGLIEISDVLERLEEQDPRAAQVVKLRFFAGLSRHEAADALGVSVATVDNDWAYARGWLKVELDRSIDGS